LDIGIAPADGSPAGIAPELSWMLVSLKSTPIVPKFFQQAFLWMASAMSRSVFGG
jgi:hypothetical protein